MTPYYEDTKAGIVIYHGDARDALLDIGQVNLVVTDPPYASGARRDADKQVRGSMLREFEDEDWFSHDAMTGWGYAWFLRGVLTDIRRHLTAGAHTYVFSDWRQTPNIYGMLEATGYRVNHCLTWDKEHFGMGTYWRNQHENIVFGSLGMPTAMLSQDRGSVLRWKPVSPTARVHPTEKPIELLRDVIRSVPGETVLDPFMGSGTTLRAAKDLGRKAIGIEIEERYCEIAAKRLAQEVMAL